MNTVEIESYFDLLTDKVGVPYFLQTEKSTFLNQAQLKYVMDTIPSNEGGVVNLEMGSPVLGNVSTLIFETAALTPTSGEITKTSVQSALDTASGSTEPVLYILNVSFDGYPCKFTRHNDWYAVQNNTFTVGTTVAPRYRQLGTKFIFAPSNSSASVKFTILKYPKAINLTTSVTCELPSQTHKRIVELAVDLAGTAMRDETLKATNPQ
jgi:hypothetical protein